ncbi:MAG: hypothetical protein ABI992_01220, partial [Chthoniobacterales bacterium]
MDEYGTALVPARRTWLKRVGLAFGIVVLALVVFHRPLLHSVGRRLAIHFAAKENLRVDFRLEGSILGGLVLRNVHAVATGPSALQSADIDLVRVDYSLWDWMTKGRANLLGDVEVRHASIVLDPAKAPPKLKLPKSDEKFSLPAVFPKRLLLSDVNLRYVSPPKDLIVEHLDFVLDPKNPGEFRIGRLQLSNGRTWTNIAASTSYENRNLILHDLVLDEQTKLRLVKIDASHLAANALDLKLEGTLVGAPVSATVSLGEKKDAMAAGIDFAAENLSLETLTAYVAPPTIHGTNVDGPKVELDTTKPALRGDVQKIAIKLDGELERPKTWTGSVVGEMKNISAGGIVFDSATIDFRASNGVGTINAIDLKQGPSTISIQGSGELPATLDGFGRSPASLELRGLAPDLAAMTAEMAKPIKGAAEFSGRINVKDATVLADFNVTAGPVDFGSGAVQRAIVNIRATKKMPPVDVERPYFEGLTSQTTLDVTDLRAHGFVLDSVAGSIRTEGRDVAVEQLIANRHDNRLALHGQYLLPLDFALAAEQPASFAVALTAPEMGDYWENESPDRVTGAMQFWAQADYRDGLGAGAFTVYGSNLRERDLVVPQLSASGSTAKNVVYLDDLTAQLNEHDYIRAQGTIGVKAPHLYNGNLAVHVTDLGTFESALRALGHPTKLAGALAINWEGQGALSNFQNSGKLKLTLEKGRFAELNKLEATVDANYSPNELNIPIVYFSSDKLMFQTVMQAKGRTLEATKIQIDQGQAKYAAGYVSIPFVWENLGTDKPLFDPEGKVLINFQTENLDLKKLAKDLGTTAPVSGLANLKLDAGGTINDLQATLALQLTGLRAEQLKDFQPATFALNAKIENKRLVVEGKLEQARIEPVEIKATLPLDLARIIQEKAFDQNTPVQASVRMPSSSVNFIRQFIPAVERVDGNVALDVKVDGSVRQPVLSGSADLKINAARFANPTLPSVTNFQARLVFAQNRLDLEQFRGELAGGPFTLSGRITFPELTKPELDLQLHAEAVLV